MKQILILIGALLVTLGLHAETYTRVQCKVGNDTITLPVPSKYIIVGRDVAWATDYFHKIETVMKDPNRCNTIMLGMVSKEDYDSYQKGEKFYGFSCEVQYRNEFAWKHFNKSDFEWITGTVEEDMLGIISDPEYKKAISNDTDFSRSMTSVVSSLNEKNIVLINKSDRHCTLALRFSQAESIVFVSYILLEGKILYTSKISSDADTMAGLDEINKWIEEIIKTTPAESPAKDDSPKS